MVTLPSDEKGPGSSHQVKPYHLFKGTCKERLKVRAVFYSKGPMLTYRLWAVKPELGVPSLVGCNSKVREHLLLTQLPLLLAQFCPNGTTPKTWQAAGGQWTTGLSPKPA